MNIIKSLSEEEIHQILAAIKPEDSRKNSDYRSASLRLAFLIMLDAGLRVGECVKLDWSDLWFNGAPVELLKVRAAISKTKIPREVPTTLRLKSAIFALYHHHITIITYSPAAYVFPSSNPENHRSTRHLSRCIKRLGLHSIGKHITAHTLRHTFATRLLRHTSTRTVQMLLGHKSLTSTQIYTHPNSIDLKKAIDSL